MNTARYKETMQQRALERQAQKQDLVMREMETPPVGQPSQFSTPSDLEFAVAVATEKTFSATPSHRRLSPVFASQNPRGKDRPQCKLEHNESESSRTTSMASSVGGGAAVEGFGLGLPSVLGQLGPVGLAGGEELSPIAPRPLLSYWATPAKTRGFDKQAGIRSLGSSSPDDNDLSDKEGDEDVREGVDFSRQQKQGLGRVLEWKRLPGETSITQGVRLYLTNLDPDTSHEENCSLVLRQVLDRIAIEELDISTLKMRHVIKIEAFLRSLVLSVPAQTWRQSVRGAFAHTAPAGNSSISPRSSKTGHGQGPQISKDELTFRMSLFVAAMKAERTGGGQTDIKLDGMRVEAVVRGYATNAAEILPLQKPARTLLPPLLFCMACEMLSVRLLAPEVREVCLKIASDYENRAKLWMSPAQNAERYLRPLVVNFTQWLRTNSDALFQSSATEGLLMGIDGTLRSSLKNQVYRSPSHFLAVLEAVSTDLTDMPLPSYDPSGGDDNHPFNVAQTLKDVSRERFDVNRVPTAPSDCWTKIQASLLEAARQHQYSSSSSNDEATVGHCCSPSYLSSLHGHDGGGGGGKGGGSVSDGVDIDDGEGNGGGGENAVHSTDRWATEQPTTTTSAVRGDAALGSSSRIYISRRKVEPSGIGDGTECVYKKEDDGTVNADSGIANTAKSNLELYVDQCAWRVLHAASRTASGGDSFFVVQDLFGGEGVLVKMATAITEPIKIRTEGMAVRVTTVDKHDIYHTSDLDITSSCSKVSPHPLITITTTMKEVIEFAPFKPTQTPLFVKGLAPDSPEEAAYMQPTNAKGGRFITIAAGLADYPEHHLDASAGVLVATSSSTD